MVKHVIRLDNQVPFHERYRQIPPHQYEEVKNHLKEMLEIGTIRKSESVGKCCCACLQEGWRVAILYQSSEA